MSQNTSGDSSLNALRHAAAAERMFVDDENPQDFIAMLDDLFAQYQPANAQAASMVYDYTKSRWILDRRQRIHDDFEAFILQVPPQAWSGEDINRLNLFDRYLSQGQLRLRRAFANLQTIRKDELAQEKWREHLSLQKQKLALDIQRFEFQKAKHAHKFKQEKEEEAAKQEAEAALEALAQYQESLKPVQTDPELGPVLVQRSFIRVENGETIIDQIIPPHATLRELIDNRAQFHNPPNFVVRYFTFLNGIPHDYEFLIEAGAPRFGEEERRFIRCNMELENYLKLADQEEAA